MSDVHLQVTVNPDLLTVDDLLLLEAWDEGGRKTRLKDVVAIFDRCAKIEGYERIGLLPASAMAEALKAFGDGMKEMTQPGSPLATSSSAS
jgi:hypothetical protein